MSRPVGTILTQWVEDATDLFCLGLENACTPFSCELALSDLKSCLIPC